jgi:hypothetical protein
VTKNTENDSEGLLAGFRMTEDPLSRLPSALFIRFQETVQEAV